MTINIPINILHCTIGMVDQNYKEDDYESFLLFRAMITNK